MRLGKVISGGQTGADQAGLRAARAAEIPTGGFAPRGWLTEDGPAPWLADYGLTECPGAGYPTRTAANARDSDGMIWFGTTGSSGYQTTIRACTRFGRSCLIVSEGITTPRDVIEWMDANRIRVLNVAGNRESINPGARSEGRRVPGRALSPAGRAPRSRPQVSRRQAGFFVHPRWGMSRRNCAAVCCTNLPRPWQSLPAGSSHKMWDDCSTHAPGTRHQDRVL